MTRVQSWEAGTVSDRLWQILDRHDAASSAAAHAVADVMEQARAAQPPVDWTQVRYPASLLTSPRALAHLVEAGVLLEQASLTNENWAAAAQGALPSPPKGVPPVRWLALWQHAPLAVHDLLTAHGVDECAYGEVSRKLLDEGSLPTVDYLISRHPESVRMGMADPSPGRRILFAITFGNWKHKPLVKLEKVVARLAGFAGCQEEAVQAEFKQYQGPAKESELERLLARMRQERADWLAKQVPASDGAAPARLRL